MLCSPTFRFCFLQPLVYRAIVLPRNWHNSERINVILQLLNINQFLEGKAFFRKQTKWTMEFNWQYNVLRDYLLDSKNGLLIDGKLFVYCEVCVFYIKYSHAPHYYTVSRIVPAT